MGGRWGGVGGLLIFSAFRMGAYSRWVLILGWGIIRINTVGDLLRKTLFDFRFFVTAGFFAEAYAVLNVSFFTDR